MAALLCHGVWPSAASGDHHLVLSSAAPGQTFYCLDYRDRDGDIEGQFTRVSREYPRRIRRRGNPVLKLKVHRTFIFTQNEFFLACSANTGNIAVEWKHHFVCKYVLNCACS